MTTVNSYPMNITPLDDVKRRKDRHGKKFLSFRARAEASGSARDRTVRVFGEDVDQMAPQLVKNVTISARVSYDTFTGTDGRRSQVMRLVSLAA